MVLVALQFALIAAIALGSGGAFTAPAALGAVGALVMAGGGLLLLWGAVALGPNLTAMPRPKDDAQLVESGPFALVRHPIYVGLGAAALGYAVWSGSWIKVAFAAALCVLLIVKAHYEGGLLRDRLAGYREYRPRLLQRLLRRDRPR